MKLKRINKRKKVSYKLKNRASFASFLIVVGVLIYVCTIPIISSGAEEKQIVSVYVNDGDTMWGIASKYFPEGDIRAAMYDIKEYNGLQNYDLKAGTFIYVPL